MKRRVAFVVAVALQVSTGAIQAVGAYTADCDTGSVTTQWHEYVHKETSSSTTEFIGAIGQATLRNLSTCYGATTKDGFSAVLPANIAKDLGPTTGLVQLGFYEDSSSNTTRFIYTPYDSSGGACNPQPGCLAYANWYNNSYGTLGDEYRFRITGVGSGTAKLWQFCIRNVTTGEAYDCTDTNRTWGDDRYGRLAWYTFETKNTNDAIGTTNQGAIRMRWMQYRRESSATWYVRTNMNSEYPVGCLRESTIPWYYDCEIQSTVDVDGDGYKDDYETLQAWTELH